MSPFFDEVSTSEMAGKFFTRQNGDENAQSARELASEIAWDPTRGSSEEPPKVGKIQTPR